MITCQQVKNAMDARFDTGDRLPPDAADHLASCPSCRAHADALGALDGALFQLADEPVRDAFVSVVQARVAREASQVRGRHAAIAIACGLMATGAVIAGWFFPVSADPVAWWTWAGDLLASPFVAPPQALISDGFVAFEAAVESALSTVPAVSAGALWGALLSALTVLIAVNGFAASRLRTTDPWQSSRMVSNRENG